ncbi:MAG: hypothetical protein ACK4YQ_07920 [Phenylobacterium sp.]|uniref:hypothetical protein n=1 Tax=Phenylobacterium sp. TaxID=1871053 RepID=UPI00391C2E1F
MGEQNRRIVDGQGAPADRARARQAAHGEATPTPPDPAPERALGVAADERQTERQAPAGAAPGEGSQGDSIG